LNLVKEKYQTGVAQRERELALIKARKFPSAYNYNHHYQRQARKIYFFEPDYDFIFVSQVEKGFAAFSDWTLPDIKWFLKNGTKMHLSLLY